jgi:hypothetical protein
VLAIWRVTVTPAEEPLGNPAVMESWEVALGFEARADTHSEQARPSDSYVFWTHSWVERDWLLAVRWLSGIGAKVGEILAPSSFDCDPGTVKVARYAEPVIALRILQPAEERTDLTFLSRSLGRRHLPDPAIAHGGRPVIDDIVEEPRGAVGIRSGAAYSGLLRLFDGSNEDFGALGGRDITVRLDSVEFSYVFDRLLPAGVSPAGR